MEDKFYRGKECYYVCGNTDTHISALTEIAKSFAKEVGVEFEAVRYEGVITESDWCRNFQLFSAHTGYTQPDGYHSIDCRATEYLRSR